MGHWDDEENCMVLDWRECADNPVWCPVCEQVFDNLHEWSDYIESEQVELCDDRIRVGLYYRLYTTVPMKGVVESGVCQRALRSDMFNLIHEAYKQWKSRVPKGLKLEADSYWRTRQDVLLDLIVEETWNAYTQNDVCKGEVFLVDQSFWDENTYTFLTPEEIQEARLQIAKPSLTMEDNDEDQ